MSPIATRICCVCVLYANPKKLFQQLFQACKKLPEVNKIVCKEVFLMSNTVEFLFGYFFQVNMHIAGCWIYLLDFYVISALLHLSVSFS